MIFLLLLFAHLTIGDIRYAVAVVLPGGHMAIAFWGLVIGIGLLIPLVIEMTQIIPRLLYEERFVSNPTAEVVASIAILIGGFALRYIIVIAGQITAPAVL